MTDNKSFAEQVRETEARMTEYLYDSVDAGSIERLIRDSSDWDTLADVASDCMAAVWLAQANTHRLGLPALSPITHASMNLFSRLVQIAYLKGYERALREVEHSAFIRHLQSEAAEQGENEDAD